MRAPTVSAKDWVTLEPIIEVSHLTDPSYVGNSGYGLMVRSTFKYANLLAGGWSGAKANTVYGADLRFQYQWIEGRLGVVRMKHTNVRIGTHTNAEVYLGINYKKMSLGWMHFSNCNDPCSRNIDKPNLGQDFIVFRPFDMSF